MSGGRKLIKENTRERLISADINRLQAFVAAYANEAMRQQMLIPVDDSLAVGTTFPVAGAITSAIDIATPTAPLYGGVLNGLMVIVPLGVTYLLITPGMLLMIDPDGMTGSSNPNPANPDDLGPSKLVYSAGVQTAGALVWTANPGPGTRVDVVECQRSDLVVETDNRDIFNPSTGLFTPAAVTKATAGELTYRIRQGVAGSGIPAPAQGWFPLAIIAAPAGATDLDACSVWDVRNLLSDLVTPYANVRSVFPSVERFGMVANRHAVPGETHLSGQALGRYNGWKIGGLFNRTFAAAYTDIEDPLFAWAPGFAPTPGFIYYVYALWPLGYVRWVRYYQGAAPGLGGRCPGGFRGIITVSHVAAYQGQPLAAVGLPAGWGLNTSTVFGQALAMGTVDSAGVMMGFVADNDMVHHETDPATSWRQVNAVVGGVPGSHTLDFTFTPGLDFPWGTKRIRLQMAVIFQNPALGDQYELYSTIKVNTGAGNNLALVNFDQRTHLGWGMIAESASLTVDVPVAADGLTAPGAIAIQWLFEDFPFGGAPLLTVLGAIAQVIGWDE